MEGGRQSPTAVVCLRRLCPPWPSSASMYRAVIRSPFFRASRPSPVVEEPGVAMIVPAYLADEGDVSVRSTVSGVGSDAEKIVAVVVGEPMLASSTEMLIATLQPYMGRASLRVPAKG